MNLTTLKPTLVAMHEDTPSVRYLRAAYDGSLEDLKAAIADGANLLAYTERDGEFKDAMLRAASWNMDDRVLTHLIDLGLDRADRSHLEPGLLNSLVIRGWSNILERLIRRGASVEGEVARHKAGYTPLMQAAQSGRDEIVGMLLCFGASISARNGRNETVLHVSRGEAVMEKLLAAGADLEAKCSGGRTPLLSAVEGLGSEALEKVQWLMAHGADWRARTLKGETALHLAAAIPNNESSIQYWIAQGIDPMGTDMEGSTALHVASRNNSAHNVITLLDMGLDRNAGNKSGHTPVDVAATPELRATFGSWVARQAFKRTTATRQP